MGLNPGAIELRLVAAIEIGLGIVIRLADRVDEDSQKLVLQWAESAIGGMDRRL